MFFDKITGVVSQLFFDNDGGSVYYMLIKLFHVKNSRKTSRVKKKIRDLFISHGVNNLVKSVIIHFSSKIS